MENAALSRGKRGRTGVTKEIITCTRRFRVTTSRVDLLRLTGSIDR